MVSRERSILTVTCYGHFVSHFNMLVFPAVLLPLTARMGLGMGEILALSFWMYLLFGVTALPWGLLADRFGSHPLLLLFHLGAGLSGLAAALTVSDPLLFSISLAGIGFFSGIYHPVGLGWIAKEFKNTSQGMAYNGMYGNLGLASAPILAGSVNYFYGIEAVYLILAVVNLSGLLLLYLVKHGHRAPERSHVSSQKQGNLIPFLVLLVAMMLGGVVYRATTVTMPAYFEIQNRDLYQGVITLSGQFGSPNLFATLATSLIYLVGMAGQYFGGRVGQSVDLGKGYLIFHLITIPAALAMAVTSNTPLVIFAMIHSFFLLGMQPLENTLVARLSPPKLHSSAYGLKFILTFGVGALSVGMVTGIKEHFGLSAVYVALALVSTSLVCVIMLLNHLRRLRDTAQHGA